MTNDPFAEQRAVNRFTFPIAKLKNIQARRDALEKVPEQYREQVKAAVIKMMGK